MSDHKTTLAELRRAVGEFVDARDWRRFHTPKNLAASIAIEAAELLEQFQWTDNLAPERKLPVVEELADVVIYCLALSDVLDIELSEAIRHKLERNQVKYPVREYRGRY